MELAAPAGLLATVEPVDLEESVDLADSIEAVEMVDPVGLEESADVADSIEAVEMVDPVGLEESVDVAESGDLADPLAWVGESVEVASIDGDSLAVAPVAVASEDAGAGAEGAAPLAGFWEAPGFWTSVVSLGDVDMEASGRKRISDDVDVGAGGRRPSPGNKSGEAQSWLDALDVPPCGIADKIQRGFTTEGLRGREMESRASRR